MARNRRWKRLNGSNGSFTNTDDHAFDLVLKCVRNACCAANCCTTLNGVNGEATNTDDVKTARRRDNRQDARINRLAAQVSRLVSLGSAGKKKKQQTKRRKTGGIKKNGTSSSIHPVVGSSPLKTAIMAQVQPRSIPRGVASVLTNVRPSQKFTSRGLSVVSVAAGTNFLGCIQPSIVSDRPSIVCFTGPSNVFTGSANSQTLASMTSLTTNTPYTFTELSDNDYNWRLVSASLLFRVVSSALNRGGTLTYIVDTDHDYSIDPAANLSLLQTEVSTDHSSVRKTLVDEASCEIIIPNINTNYIPNSGSMSENHDWCSTPNIHAGCESVALATSGILFAPRPVCVFSYLNNAANSITIDLELIEHWEISGRKIHSLHTPSVASAAAHSAITAMVNHSHKSHSLMPHLSFKNVVKDAMALSENKDVLKEAPTVLTTLAML